MAERLCVVMPVYNEQEAIGAVLVKWDAMLRFLGIEYEIRPYNDGSKDDSLAVMQRVASTLGDGVNVRDKPNGGHGNTILTGYRDAAEDGFDWVFQIDSDDEMGPEKFCELWSRRHDYDFLVGTRDGRVQALPRKVISFVSRLCVRIFFGKSVWDVNTPYRLMRVEAFKGFFEAIPLTTFAPNVILSGLAARHGLRCWETRVPQHDRTTGEVSIKKWKLLKAAAKSLWQTVSLALWGLHRDDNYLQKTARLASGVVCLLGFAFCFFRIWDFRLLIAAALLVFGLLAVGRTSAWSRISAFPHWCEKHWQICIAAIITVALLERLFVCMILAGGHVSSFQIGDSPSFWKEALEMAQGAFPETKSWITVGMYALTIKLFGNNLLPAVCLNVCFQILTALLIFVFASNRFGKLAGMVACSFYAWSPFLASLAIRIYSEHFCHFFIVLEMVLLSMWLRGGRFRILSSAGIGCLLPIMLWTRGEAGVIMGCIVAIAMFWELLVSHVNWKKVVPFGLIIAAVAASMLFVGFKLNAHYHGTRTFLCSNDNYWPRLYGCNYEYAGKSNPVDIPLICDRYAALSGSEQRMVPRHMTCPSELVPLIKEEISRRWREMSSLQICKLVFHKEVRTWNISRKWTIHFNRWWFGVDAILNVILSIATFLGLLCTFRMSQRMRCPSYELLLAVAPMIYIMAVFAIVFVVEGNNKYGVIAHVMLPLCAAAYWKRSCVSKT